MNPVSLTRRIALAAVAALICGALASQAAAAPAGVVKGQRLACEQLRQEIAAKIEANGVRHYSLTIVEPDQLDGAMNVGRCDGGSRRIAYRRLAPHSEAIAVSESDPAAIEVLAVVPKSQ